MWTPDPTANQALTRLIDGQRGALGESLVGVYLFGSAAMGSFEPGSSDIRMPVSDLPVRMRHVKLLPPPPAQIADCGHPFVFGYANLCQACFLRKLHDRKAGWDGTLGPNGRCPCELCLFLEGLDFLDSEERTARLLDRAEHLASDARELFVAACRDEVDLEGFIQSDLTNTPDFGLGFDRRSSMRYEEYMRTPEWAEHRRRALKRAGGRCQGCNTDRHLETHHRTYERRGSEEPMDLTVLCASCHMAVHLVADGRRGVVRSQSRQPG